MSLLETGCFQLIEHILWKLVKGLGDKSVRHQRSAATDAEMRIWQAVPFDVEIKLSLLWLQMMEQPLPLDCICCGLTQIVACKYMFVFMSTASAPHVNNSGYFSSMWPYNLEVSVCKGKDPVWNSYFENIHTKYIRCFEYRAKGIGLGFSVFLWRYFLKCSLCLHTLPQWYFT